MSGIYSLLVLLLLPCGQDDGENKELLEDSNPEEEDDETSGTDEAPFSEMYPILSGPVRKAANKSRNTGDFLTDVFFLNEESKNSALQVYQYKYILYVTKVQVARQTVPNSVIGAVSQLATVIDL